MSKHTPGPWGVEGRERNTPPPCYVVGPNGEIIAKVYDTGAMQDHGLADACLIATAPDLLNVAAYALEFFFRLQKEGNDGFDGVIEQLQTTIIKAGGRP